MTSFSGRRATINEYKKEKKRRKGFWNYVSVESPLDERQKLISTKIQVEGISIALVLVAINTVIMDYLYKWCENYFIAMVLLVVISGIYMTVRRGAKGCLFGVKGARSEILTVLVAAPVFPLTLETDIESAQLDMFEIMHNGMLTQRFCFLLFWGLDFVEAMILLFFMIREKRAKKRRAESSDKEEL